MRFNNVLASALFSSAALYGGARADAIEEVLEDTPSSAAESSTSTRSAIEHPTFTVSGIATISSSQIFGGVLADILPTARHYQSSIS
jgi:hypothetical protein